MFTVLSSHYVIGGLLDIFQKLEDKTFCPSPGHVSDNFCDDENNIASCYWDGGDCCERRVPGWESYCSECACKDPGFLSACPSEENYGDQFCDDDNNIAACNWDGGDCCNSLMPGWDTYCAECRCKDPSQGGAAQGCMEPNHVGDGYCDDGNNNGGCQWDGGDCCYNTGESWDDYCQECACKDPTKIEVLKSEKCNCNKYFVTHWMGFNNKKLLTLHWFARYRILSLISIERFCNISQLNEKFEKEIE